MIVGFSRKVSLNLYESVMVPKLRLLHPAVEVLLFLKK